MSAFFFPALLPLLFVPSTRLRKESNFLLNIEEAEVLFSAFPRDDGCTYINYSYCFKFGSRFVSSIMNAFVPKKNCEAQNLQIWMDTISGIVLDRWTESGLSVCFVSSPFWLRSWM